jgi:uncharacterized spore protein YtfJ
MMQEVYIKIFRGLRTFDESRPLLPWLKQSDPLNDTWRLQKQILQHTFGFVSYIPINHTISSSAKKGVAILAGAAGGGGVGCKIAPNAILVIKNEELSVIPLTNRGSLEKIVEMVPEIMAKVEGYKTESGFKSEE